MKCYALIISCHKNYKKIEEQDVSKLPFEHSYFLGKPVTYDFDNKTKINIVDCSDAYESLIYKVYESIKWVHHNIDYDYILKTDDDIGFNTSSINTLYKKIINDNTDYTGFFCRQPREGFEYMSTYHYGKCNDKIVNSTPVMCPSDSYASGGAYFLSRDAVEFYLDTFPHQDMKMIYEDVMMGVIMNKSSSLNITTNNNTIVRESFTWT